MVSRIVGTITVCALVSACGTPAPVRTEAGDLEVTISTPPAPARGERQLHFDLASGTYRCELGETVELRRIARDDRQIELAWAGNRYTMLRNASYSGLPRYEHRASGLVWIDLPWKSVLLDSNTGRPVANECKPG
jgi:hypothetical protein